MSDLEIVKLWAVISGVALFIGAITRLPAGILSDWIGAGKAILLAYGVYIGSLALILVVNSTVLYIIAASTIRFGLNLFAMSGRTIVSRSRRDKGLKNGLLSSMVGLGSFVGPTLLAYILDNYPPDYILYASLVIVLLDLVMFGVSMAFIPYIYSKITSDVIDLELSIHIPFRWGNLRTGVKQPGVIKIIILFFSGGMIYGLITTIYTIYGYNILSISLTALGLITGLGAVIQAVWAPIMGRLYGYVKDQYVRVFSWIILVVASIIMVFSKLGSVYFILGYFLLNFANASYFVMEITRMSQVVRKEEFSMVFGVATSFIILATAIAGYISPIFYNFSTEGTFIAALCFSALSLFLILITS